LDGTGQDQDDLGDLLVLGDPDVEGLALGLRHIPLVPVRDILGALEHLVGSVVDSRLEFLKRWLEHRTATLKVLVRDKERLHYLVGANAFLHLVEGVLGGGHEGLVHEPVVVLRELLDVLSRDGINVLVELV